MSDRAAQGRAGKRRGSLSGLLARSYLLFTAVLLAITLGVYLIWDAQSMQSIEAIDQQFGVTDADSFNELTYDEALQYSQAYEDANRESMKVWLLLIPLYLATMAVFILWMRKSIGGPLKQLDDAVEAQLQGRQYASDGDGAGAGKKAAYAADCGGPREIRVIAESFDELSTQLEKSERERRRLDEGRQKLIADISHDLKTPITVISGYADALCAGKVPPDETDRYLRAIQQKTAGLVDLIGTFSEYGKVGHPEFKLQRKTTDICEFMRAYLARRYDEIGLEGFSLEVDIPDSPLLVSLDELQFQRVLDNLLSNSLKHNRLGTVLSIDVMQADSNAVLLIADNGVRIPRESAEKIFEPFVTGDTARSSSGSGLGLSISRRIVELHGGTIALSATPRPGRSNEFVVTLPLANLNKH